MATMLNPNAIQNGSITKDMIDVSVLDAKQNITDATLATIAKTIVGAINEVYKGGLEDASIATSKIEDGAITEPKLDTDLVNVITSAVQPTELASAIATALASYVAKSDIVDNTGSATDKVISQHGVTEAIDGVTNKVTELDKEIYGTTSKTISLESTKDDYNTCLFDSPLPAGSIITAIDKSVYNMNFYMVSMDGSLDISANYDNIVNHLPYTTTQEYKGASLNKVGTLTIKIGEDVPSIDERLKKLETLRQSIYINREDTEIDVLTKMLLAFETGNVDVIYPDNAYYELNNVYEYMKQTLKWNWTLGLPIGNGCRYYGNGTTIKSTFVKAEHSDFAGDGINIFDTKVKGSNLEVYDFVLINNGGTYCIHDEVNSTTNPYFHKYSNLYLQCDTLTCFGCGVGFDTSIVMQNCLFKANTANINRNFLLHAPQNNPDNKKIKLSVKIDGCFFASDQPIGINPSGFDVSRDETILVVDNSQYSTDISEETKSVITDLIVYNNNVK